MSDSERRVGPTSPARRRATSDGRSSPRRRDRLGRRRRSRQLITALQSTGLRVEVPIGARTGGAGPADAGMLYVEGVQTTVPTSAGVRRRTRRTRCAARTTAAGRSTGTATGSRRRALPRDPRYYDLTTADGIPYWQIALLHLDSVASTVLQTCAYWGNDDQCAFCGIGVTLANGRTIAKKTPAMLAEVAVAARDLDGAVDATLTTGSTATPDRGALYVGALRRGGQGGRRAAGAGAVRAAVGPGRDRPGRRHGHRLGRHPRRDLRPRGARPGRPRQGTLGHRRLLHGLGAGGRRVRGRARCRPT